MVADRDTPMMDFKLRYLSLILIGAACTAAHAGLVDTINDNSPGLSGAIDGTLDADEFGAGNSQKVLGSGTGFGGTVGNGSLYLDSSATDLKVGFTPGASINDNLVIYIDSRAGGVLDSDISDRQDGSRYSVTDPLRDGNIDFGRDFLPDFAIVIGGFGFVSFELTPGTDITFKEFFGNPASTTGTSYREASFAKSMLGDLGDFNFVVLYASSDGYLSNESMPGGIAGDNPGFGTAGTSLTIPGYDRFQVQVVPEPGAWAALGLGAAAMLRRRRRA